MLALHLGNKIPYNLLWYAYYYSHHVTVMSDSQEMVFTSNVLATSSQHLYLVFPASFL